MPLMRSRAMSAARFSSTPAILVRYLMVPRLSSIGLQASEQACAAAESGQRGASRQEIEGRHQSRAQTLELVGAEQCGQLYPADRVFLNLHVLADPRRERRRTVGEGIDVPGDRDHLDDLLDVDNGAG